MNMVSTASSRAFIGLIAAALLAGFAAPLHAKEFLKGERPQTRGYSQAVITEGGKIVWLAGQLAVVDDSGKSLAGDLDGQVRQIFKLLNATLEKDRKSTRLNSSHSQISYAVFCLKKKK